MYDRRGSKKTKRNLWASAVAQERNSMLWIKMAAIEMKIIKWI